MKRRHVAGIALAVMLAGSVAHAQSEQALKAAQTRFREGVALYKKADYEAARVAFAQAYAVLKSPDVLLNLALAELNSGGHSIEALQHLRQYERDPKADPAVVKGKLPALIERAYKETGHLKLVDAPAGAIVSVDGQPTTTGPMDVIDVGTGKHLVEARVQDKTLSAEIVAIAGEITPVKFGVAPAPPVPPTTAPVPSASPAPTSSASAAGTADVPPPAPSGSFWTTRRYVGVAVAGAGVLSIAAGGYFGLKAQDDADRAKALRAGLPPGACATGSTAGCGDLNAAYDAQDRDHTLGIVFLGVGAAALVTGAALILWPQSTSPTGAAVVPVFSARGGGLFVRGDF